MMNTVWLIGVCVTLCAAQNSMIKDSECDVLYTCWTLDDGTKVAWRRSVGDNRVEIQMSRADTGERNIPLYMSIGFSSDQGMGDDAVTACVFTGDLATVRLAWNNGKTNELLPEDFANTQTKLLSARRSQNELYCHFTQMIPALQDVGGMLPLDRDYYLLAAHGTANQNALLYHNGKRWVSPTQQNIAAKEFDIPLPTGVVAVPINVPSPPPINSLPAGNNLPPPTNNLPAVPPLPQPQPTPPPPDFNGLATMPPGGYPEPEPETHSESEPEPENNTVQTAGQSQDNGASTTTVATAAVLIGFAVARLL